MASTLRLPFAAVVVAAVFFVVDIIIFYFGCSSPTGVRVVGEEKRISQKLRDVTKKLAQPDESERGNLIMTPHHVVCSHPHNTTDRPPVLLSLLSLKPRLAKNHKIVARVVGRCGRSLPHRVVVRPPPPAESIISSSP